MQKLRYLLWPFSILYGIIIYIRNRFYDWGIFKSWSSQKTFTICVGNLEVGGTGKTPMLEYLIQRFSKKNLKIATLSRGYGRKTKGFKWVETDSLAIDVGDEPLQFKRKYPRLTVAVCESRIEGVQKLENDFDIILLDDAFQHRALKPHFSILLFEFNSLFKGVWVFPVGNYRDLWGERRRADSFVITKCPDFVDESIEQYLIKKLKTPQLKPTYFTQIEYLNIKLQGQKATNDSVQAPKLTDFHSAYIITGIAKPEPFVNYIKKAIPVVKSFEFPDHYNFKEEDIQPICQEFQTFKENKSIILTTEKDAQRLKEFEETLLKDVLWGYIPIRTRVSGAYEDRFFQQLDLAYETWKQKPI